ncbi:cytochrome c biogenesis protein [Thermoproteus tenax]|nr:cytochrome c biogenesis protein [Thermoproteus tenax]
MRLLLAVLLMAALALAGSVAQLGGLSFYEVSSIQDLSSYLAAHPGPTLVFVHEEGCPACEYMISNVFTNAEVEAALAKFNLVAVDTTYVPVSSIPVYLNGSVFLVENGQAGYSKPYFGPYQVPIIGTPTTLVGDSEGGELYLRGLLLGGLPPQGFLEFLNYSGMLNETALNQPQVSVRQSPGPQPLLALPVAFAVGAASVFSPCVLPVLTVGAVATAARRNLGRVLAGMALAFSAFGAGVSALGQAVSGVKTALEGIGGSVLLLLGLVLMVPALERRFVISMSGLQTRASKMARGAGDFALGLSLGAVWTPCIAPFMGVAAVSALISGNFLVGFAIMIAYALGLSLAVYAVLKAVSKWGKRAAARSIGLSKWGRRLELIVGAVSILLGILLLGEALGLGTWSATFGQLESLFPGL